MTGTERTLPDPRVPTEHGVPVSEVVDLDGPVARITRRTYVHHEWTELVLMVPADHAHDNPGGSLSISMDRKTLKRLLEQLAWPT